MCLTKLPLEHLTSCKCCQDKHHARCDPKFWFLLDRVYCSPLLSHASTLSNVSSRHLSSEAV